MRKVIVGAFTSLDGVMQAPGGPDEDPSGGFEHGGWIPPFWDDALTAAMNETFAQPFDLLLGRKTYDIFAAYWPYVDTEPKSQEARSAPRVSPEASPRTSSGATGKQEEDFDQLNADIARTFNRIVKYVATHRPDSLSWQNSRDLGSDVAATVRELKQGDGPPLLTQGSTELLHALFAADLVDEIRLIVFPLVLGKGKKLFDSGAVPGTFRLTKSTVSPNGVFIATYERAGDVATGSF